MVIRTADADDSEGIKRLLDEQNAIHVDLLPTFFRLSPASEEGIIEVISSPEDDFVVAEENGSIVGLIQLRESRTGDLPILIQKRYASIKEMIVAEVSRREGVGSRLMDAAKRWATERGLQYIRTSVTPNNEPAKSFYSQEGFRHIMYSIEMKI